MKTLKEVYSFKTKIKKLSQLELRSIILAEANSIREDASPEKVSPNRFPLELSKAASMAGVVAKNLVTKGDDDGSSTDDSVGASEGSMPVDELKPSQSSMNIEKACQFALCAILKVKPFPSGPGGDLGAIITNDNHIMDGHHRWIATGMVDPSASVGGFIVEFPAKQMIAALNMITVGLGITSGKQGSGGFDQFNEAGILPVIQKLVKKGFWGADAEQCQEACNQFSGLTGDKAVASTAEIMGKNVSQLTLSVPSGFPARPDMPVISKGKGHLSVAINLLRKGKVDLNEPYADISSKEKNKSSEQKESINKKRENLILERWRRLAGI
jgi:hypothetical protein